MPVLKRGDVSLYYEEYGTGYPIFCMAPGSLQSSISYWQSSTAPLDPTKELADAFRVIVMDQRNAGQSWAPITAADGWHSYTADHIALLDHLGVEHCHLLGQCIGAGGFPFGLMEAQPDRFSAAVLMQPSGRIGPDTRRPGGFHRWRDAIIEAGDRNPRPLGAHPEATPEVLDGFYRNMYTYDFVYSTRREFVPTCRVPLLVLAGNDEAHPFALAEEIVRLAPEVEFIPEWKSGEPLVAAKARIHEFLLAHTPEGATRGA